MPLLRVNRTQIKSLRRENKEIAAIVDEFEDRTKTTNLSLLIFYELMKSMYVKVSLSSVLESDIDNNIFRP